jgi:hypothetical protein
MFNIQIITDEWIDIIHLNELDNSIYRKGNNDKGTYILYEDKININWEIWGLEVFYKVNDIYYNIHNLSLDSVEIQLESKDWTDIGILDLKNTIITRKYFPEENGKFRFDNNDLLVEWKNWGLERFYPLNNGKIYTNTVFGVKIKNNKKEIKLMAIVFPQFHEIPENNLFWGKGFTEWTLLKNIPRIVNDQIIKKPHQDIGYFNLNDYNHRKYMKTLANKYNIYGFCYYHYWFKNKKILYEPKELMLVDDEPNKPFLFCWANEQWTKRWDGGNNEILLKQDYTDMEGNIDHFNYLLKFFKNKNYIKKNNKPIFIFYRIEDEDKEQIKDIINLWNDLSKKEGFNGIHFLKFLGPFNNKIILKEIEGYVEFEPGYCTQKYFNDIISEDENKIFEEYDETIYLNKNSDINELVKNKKLISGYEHYKNINEKEKKIRTSKFFVYDGENLYNKIIDIPKIFNEQHRGISVSWNNTPRRNFINNEYSKYPHYYKNINPKLFGECFYNLLNKIIDKPNDGEDFLFISAWNEWNEQAILEPNNEDGYQYLQHLNENYLKFYDYPKKKNILNICHKGGGTEKYMNDLKHIFIEYNFIDFKNFDNNINYLEIYSDIDIIHINSILFNNLKENYIYFINNFCLNKTIYLTIHDYQWLFPNNPNINKENLLMEKIETKDNFEFLLEKVNKIIFPSNNIFNNYNNIINLESYKEKIHIIGHLDKIINHDFLVVPKINLSIDIAFIGYFINYKGSNLFKLLGNKINFYKGYKINYHVFGYVEKDNKENNLIFYNTYDDNNIINVLHSKNIHGITHLSLFEESYCYALTNSINSGIPIFYLNRGSIKERLPSKNKYISTEIDDINTNFILFLDYLIENQNSNNFYKLDENIQPNKWYLENY